MVCQPCSRAPGPCCARKLAAMPGRALRTLQFALSHYGIGTGVSCACTIWDSFEYAYIRLTHAFRTAQSCVAKHAIQAKQRQCTQRLLQENVIDKNTSNRRPTLSEVYQVVFSVQLGSCGAELEPSFMQTNARGRGRRLLAFAGAAPCRVHARASTRGASSLAAPVVRAARHRGAECLRQFFP